MNMDERGIIDAETIAVTLIAVFLLVGVMFIAGYGIGRKNLVVDIDAYGCEKVIAKYHGTNK